MSVMLNKVMQKIEEDSYKSDQEILDEIIDKNDEFEEAVEDVIEGFTNVLIAKGPPGIGKTKSLEIATKLAGVVSTDMIAGEYQPWTKEEKEQLGVGSFPWKCLHEPKVDGALIRTGAYGCWQFVTDIFANRDSGALVIDDNDTVLKDDEFMSLIMNATEQEAFREIAYSKAASTNELQLRGVPARFTTKTPIIILSNIDFDMHIQHANAQEDKTGKPAPSYIKRWEALMHSRGKYIDLDMNTPQRVRLWCEHLIDRTKMLEQSEWLTSTVGRPCTPDEVEEVKSWVRRNQKHLKTRLDLRMYNKVASKLIRKGSKFERSAKIDFLKVV